MTVKFTNPLKNIKVASPCSASWEEMKGNDRQRFCGQCELNVYNLSAMTITEAESLILNTEGRLCARFYRRPDGTVITKDCPVGLKAVKKTFVKGLDRICIAHDNGCRQYRVDHIFVSFE